MTNSQFNKFVIAVNGAVPLLILGYDALNHHLGANPVNFAIRTTGMLSLIFLILSLAVTPVRKLTGWNSIVGYRRTIGLYAFFYGLLHLSIFFWFDRSADIVSTISEIRKRRYIWFGMASLLLMLPLAVTSTNWMIKKLGGKRWQLLHRLAYPAGIAAVIHYYMLVKSDIRQPVIFGIVLGLLLLFRLLHRLLKLQKPRVIST